MTKLVLLACLAATPMIASAEPERPALNAADRAKQHFERARTLAQSKQYAAAYDEFAAGYALAPRPLFLFNMGEMARAQGQTPRAREHYERYLAAEPDGAFAKTATQRLAELSPAAPPPAATPPPPAPAPAPAPVAQQSPRVPAPSEVTLPRTQPAQPASFVLTYEPRPLYKRTGFWIGVGAAVVAGTVAIYAVSRDGDTCSGNCIDLR